MSKAFKVILVSALLSPAAAYSLGTNDACTLKEQAKWEQDFIISKIAVADTHPSINVVQEMEELIEIRQIFEWASGVCSAI